MSCPSEPLEGVEDAVPKAEAYEDVSERVLGLDELENPW